MTFQQYNVYDGLTACRVVATSNQTGTYINGPLNNGVGATFTYATGALTIDSVVVVAGDSVALVGQTNGWENGIYICTTTGATGVAAVLTRRQDMQCIEQLKVGQWTTVGAGTVSMGSMFVVVEPLPAQFGIDALLLSAAIPAGSGTASTKAASDNTKPTVASVNGATVVGHIAAFSDVAGTIESDVATAINSGNLQAGISGTAGTLRSFPAGALSGVLIVAAATNASGNFNTTISNATAVGQSQVISIPDSGGATANFLLSALAGAGTQHITSGSLQVDAGNLSAGSSGSAGSLISFPATAGNGTLIISALNAGGAFNTTIRNSVMGQSTVYSLADIGAATGGIPVSTAPAKLKFVAGAAAAGGAATQNFADAFCTAGSVVIGNWVTQTNPAEVVKIVPGVGSFDVVSTVDAGVGTFSYFIMK